MVDRFVDVLFSYYSRRFAPTADELGRKNFMLAMKNILSYLEENKTEVEKGNVSGYNEMMHLIVSYCKAQGLSEACPGVGFQEGLYTLVYRACYRLGMPDNHVFMSVKMAFPSGTGTLSEILYFARPEASGSSAVVEASCQRIRLFLKEHAPSVRLD